MNRVDLIFLFVHCFIVSVLCAVVPDRQWTQTRVLSGVADANALPTVPPLNFQYHHYDELTAYLKDIHNAYPQITHLYSIGKSVQGRELWVLAISSTPREHALLKPEVKYVGNIHGNEPVGREMMLHLIEYLVVNYPRDEYVKWLLERTRIHIMPSLNPDGFEVAREGDCGGVQGRYNSRGFDLNRNFPDYFKQTAAELQPESQAVAEWLRQIPFVLSAGLHGGALVASYPFDNKDSSAVLDRFRGFQPSLTPDDDTFRHLATSYSFNHRTMHLGKSCFLGDSAFPNGTTNGAAWYYLAGGMQDYNYVWYGCMELTLELSCCKYPPASELNQFWEDNRQALVKYLGEAHRGVLGTVRDTLGHPIPGATVKVLGRQFGSKTTALGEYWRILLPGVYTIHVSSNGYHPREEVFQVSEDQPTLLNITLEKSDQIEAEEEAAAAAVVVADQVTGPVSPSVISNVRPVSRPHRPSLMSTITSFFNGLIG